MRHVAATEKYVHYDVPDGRVIVSIKVYVDGKFSYRRLKSYSLLVPTYEICDVLKAEHQADTIAYQQMVIW